MVGKMEELSDIQRFYKDSTVFLTGATGFIGKLFLEKVLRALPVKKVYILVRSKKNKSASERFDDIFKSVAFDTLKRSNPDVFKKVFIVEGDCFFPNLNLSDKNRKTLIEEVDVIFHCAATVRFTEHIKKATLTNVRGTRDLILLAKQIPKIKTFVYVGTAFSNSNRLEIKEKIYEPRITAENLIAACESLEDNALDLITKELIGDWPNTYTFTKQVTEDYIGREGRDLPICICRPSIVVSTDSEPVSAFVDNVFTLVGFLLLNALGIARVWYDKNITLDIFPADYVINECIAAGWYTGESFKPRVSEIPVVNISSAQLNPITMERLYTICEYYCKMIPTEKIIFYPYYFRTSCKYNYMFWNFILHTTFAFMVDIGLRLQGKKPRFLEGIRKLQVFQATYEHFTTNQFYHHVDNTRKMLKKMSFKDKELFNFNIESLDWNNYLAKYGKGVRVYILKDSMDTIEAGRKKMTQLRRNMIIIIGVSIVVTYVLGKIILFRALPFLFGVVMYLLRLAVC